MTAALGVCALLLATFADPAAGPEAAGLNLADLAAYRSALSGRPEGEAVAVTFRQLWDDPERYRGRRVRVEGQVLRRFRQGAFGTFPPLVEAWAVAPPGDPFCLVYPDPNPGAEPKDRDGEAAPGASVRFEGIFLRQIRYQGGDAPRLAPLIVGDRSPAVTKAAPEPVRLDGLGSWDRLPRGTWVVGLTIAGLFGLLLARRHLRAPAPGRRRRPREFDPPPEFLDPGAGA